MEEDPDKFVEISRNIVRILNEKQVRLNRRRPASGVRYPPDASSKWQAEQPQSKDLCAPSPPMQCQSILLRSQSR
jgi:hypothetical protein